MENAQQLQQIAQEKVAQLNERLIADGFEGAELQSNQTVVVQFIPVALNLMAQHGGISMPGAEDQLIEFDENTGEQLITLFSEGVYYAIKKCFDMKLTVELTVNVNTEQGPAEVPVKDMILQNLALDLYNQATQIVASTYGQENTPEFQFTIDQQIDMIQQTSESGILYYINEFEKQNGSIESLRNPEEENEMFDSLTEEEEAQANAYEQPEAPVVPEPKPQPPKQPVQEEQVIPEGASAPLSPVPTIKPVVAKGPSQHDKYAAVSLLLLKVKDQDRQRKILSSFKGEERELISYYLNPQHIMQNLDITCVQNHLKHFTKLVKSGNSGLKSDALTSVEKIIPQLPEDELLMWSVNERPRVKQFVTHYLPVDESVLMACGINPEQDNYFSENLPPRLESVLNQYLMKKFNVPNLASESAKGGVS